MNDDSFDMIDLYSPAPNQMLDYEQTAHNRPNFGQSRSISTSSYGSMSSSESANSSPEMSTQNWPYMPVGENYVSPSFIQNFQPSFYTEPQLAYLYINIQPVPIFRFRYTTELKASQSSQKKPINQISQISTHGSLDYHDDLRRKCSPSVSLRNFPKPALIRCDLYQVTDGTDGQNAKLHPHFLCRKKSDNIEFDPFFEEANAENNWTVEFSGMSIINTIKNDVTLTIITKETNKMNWCANVDEFNSTEKLIDQKPAKPCDIDLNRVALGFEAYERINDHWIKICGPILSTPICNSDNVTTSKLKICKLSSSFGLITGKEVLLMFVEKVSKKDIFVIFEEIDQNSNWRVVIKPSVHHQYGIEVKTPPYKNPHSEHDVTVHIKLFRKSDGACSDPKQFTYCSEASLAKQCEVLILNALKTNEEKFRKISDLNEMEFESHKIVTDAAPMKSEKTGTVGPMLLKLKAPRVPGSERSRERFLELCTGRKQTPTCTEDASKLVDGSSIKSEPQEAESEPESEAESESESESENSEAENSSEDQSDHNSSSQSDDDLPISIEPKTPEVDKADANESRKVIFTEEDQDELADLLKRIKC